MSLNKYKILILTPKKDMGMLHWQFLIIPSESRLENITLCYSWGAITDDVWLLNHIPDANRQLKKKQIKSCVPFVWHVKLETQGHFCHCVVSGRCAVQHKQFSSRWANHLHILDPEEIFWGILLSFHFLWKISD